MKPYLIRISSQKGGVGKTTIAVNLAIALQSEGHSVLLVDADSTNPSVGFHLGMTKSNSGFKDVAKGAAHFNDVITIHSPSGLHVVNGTINTKPFVITKDMARRMMSMLRRTHYDFVIVDSQPGYYNMEAIKYFDEIIIVTTPDMPSCVSAMRMFKDCEREKLKSRLIVNRMHGKRHEVDPNEILIMCPNKVAGFLPEDEIIPFSIAEHVPALLLDKRSKFSKAMVSLVISLFPKLKKPGVISHITRKLHKVFRPRK